MSLPELTTERLRLRPMQRGDAVALHAWLADPAVMRYWSTLPHRDLAETVRWVELSLQEGAAGRAVDYVALKDREVIGRVAFWQGSEIGFFFGPEHQGRGYAGEALAAFCRFGFDDLGFDEIRADVDPDNAPSLRVLERLGFIRTGFAEKTIEIGGRWFDSVYLTLARPRTIPPRV
jgi:RimJ/RimL family protein N-acetyltransferase